MVLKRISSYLIVLLLVGGLTFAPVEQVTTAVQAGNPVTYNIYATDAYIRTANGEIIYNYGFIGGRQGATIQYQKSVGMDGSVFENGTATLPAMSAGPVSGIENELIGNAQFPAPLIYAAVGDPVTINLKNLGTAANPNAPNDPHSIHLHGLDVNAANDGVPETSVGAIPANSGDSGAGNIIVYMFTPKVAGTYMYHCHQEADIHVNMGMYGALVIYNPTDAAIVGSNGKFGPGAGKGMEYGYAYDRDYVLLLSEIDSEGHASEQNRTPYNWAHYEPEYWFINGLSFPQTIHAGFPGDYTWDDWIAAHPGYDPFIIGSVSKSKVTGYWGMASRGEKVLLRMINMGFETQPMHMHAFHGKVLASDQRPFTWSNTPKQGFGAPTPFGKGEEKQTLLIGSGETYDWLVDIGQQALYSTYPAGTYSKVDPSGAPALNTTTNPAIAFDGDPYIGGPKVGPINDTATGGITNDSDANVTELTGGTIKGQLFPFHNHDDYKATNNGLYPGGMFTMFMTVP